MARRAAGEGTLRQRKDGRWEGRAHVTLADGRHKRVNFLGRSQGDALAKLQAGLHASVEGRFVAPAKLTVGAFLDQWLANSVVPRLRPSTVRSYSGIVKVHLKPSLGRYQLARLTPQHVQAFLNAKSASHLSPRSVSTIRAVLRKALTQAERWNLVTRNVAKLVEPPRVQRHEISPLAPDQARTFLEAIRGDRLEALFIVAIGTGLRQGEILGLAWPDVDLDAGTITVRQALQRIAGRLVLVEPKSATSHRVVALPAFVRMALTGHRTKQRRERLLADSRWKTDDRDLVFRTTIGTPCDGIRITRRFQAILVEAGLPRQRFHDLRHACASLLLAQGVAPRVVMELLGHSQISLTLNTYSHVIPELGRAAADRMDELLGS